MARLAAGHDAALNSLMERHAERLFHYLVRALQNEEDAADLAQETFFRVYQNREKFDPKQTFSTWLFAIASNLVRDRYRWRKRHPQVSLNTENEDTGNTLGETLPDAALTASETLQGNERAEAVRRAVAELPELLRVPLLLSEDAAEIPCGNRADSSMLAQSRGRAAGQGAAAALRQPQQALGTM